MAKFCFKSSLNYWLKFFFTGVLPLIVWMGWIFILSNREKVAFTNNYPVSFAIFKSLHLIEYGILFLLWVRFLFLAGSKNPYFLALLFTFAYGLSDEWHQSFIAGREGKLLDAFVDGFGGLIAWFLIKKNQFVNKLIRL